VRKCPTCGKPVEWTENPSRPFCSERCKLIDFDRWASEDYRVPGQAISSTEIGERPPLRDQADEDEDGAVS